MTVVRWVQAGAGLILGPLLGKPLLWLGRGVFRIFLLPAYASYIKIKQRVRNNPHLAGIRSIVHFFERYALYAALVALGVFGVTNNLFAQTIRPDEVGRGAIWTTFVQADGSDLIVETGLTQAPVVATSAALAVGGPIPVVTTDETATEPVQVEAAPGTDVPITDSVVGSISSASTIAPARKETEQYTVQGGDTISTIAEQFGISSRTILWANSLNDTDFIKPGQSLKIPPASGYLYTVKNGDTVASLAQKYKGNEQQILEANGLPLADALQIGQEVIIPGGEPPAPPAPVVQPRTLIGQVFGNNPPASAPPSSAKFIWPTPNRRINQYYRGRFHTGLDIEGDYSSPIYAAAGGTVEYASADRSGYGLHVVINHGNGFRTLYAHASKIFVKAGERVGQGETIAMVGSTGRSTGTHLHFEIRTGSGFVNPLAYY